MPVEEIDAATAKGHDKGTEAAHRLKAALARHGITLPSLYGGWPVAGTPMVELGGCRADVADALSAVLEGLEPNR
ncbi:hypothetical protein ACWDTQ_26635 [Streptomyces cellulosae]